MWDKEINDVARRLTEEAPRADLKARVVARITSTPGQPRRWMLAVPAAVGVAAIALLAWMTHTRQPSREELSRAVVETRRTPMAPTPERTRRAEERAIGSARSLAGRSPAARRVRVNGHGTLNPGHSFALPDQIAFDPVSVPMIPAAESVTTEPISPEPLAFEALEIRPLIDPLLDHE